MRLGKYLLAAAAATMAVAQVSAAAVNPAASLSISQSVRTGTPTTAKNKAMGGGVIIAVLAAAAVIAGIVVVAQEDDKTDSP